MNRFAPDEHTAFTAQNWAEMAAALCDDNTPPPPPSPPRTPALPSAFTEQASLSSPQSLVDAIVDAEECEMIPASRIYRPPRFSPPSSPWAFRPPPGPPQSVPSLVTLVTERLSHRMDLAGPRLAALPEDVAEQLLVHIITRGGLTPSNARWFYDCGHAKVEKFMRENVSLFRGIPPPDQPGCH